MDNFTVDFLTRDFSQPFTPALAYSPADPVFFVPQSLSWSAYGGQDQAVLVTNTTLEKVFDLPSLIRCPVFIRDHFGSPAWWGFVSEIKIQFEQCLVSLSIDQLFNSVKVNYSFISPDNKLGQQLHTPTAANPSSQSEYGIKELSVKRFGIDDDFALNLRDHLLSQFAWPSTVITQNPSDQQVSAVLICKGWFHTLDWQTYNNPEGFWGNYGPGPGIFVFDSGSSVRYPSQRFTAGAAAQLKYAYFMLRKIGTPARNLAAQLRDAAGALLVNSGAYNGALLEDTSYTWVRFEFSPPYALTGGVTYMIGVTSTATDGSHHFGIRTDEDQNFIGGYGRYYNGSSWLNLPSITQPGGRPDLYFRVIAVTDTGTQLFNISTHGNQFFNRIEAPATGVLISPYRDNDFSHKKELEFLMSLGTSNQLKVLANVTPDRQLIFSEQPSPDNPAGFLDRQGRFFTNEGTPVYPWKPPIGKWILFSGTSRINHPWDKHRIPASFVEKAKYNSLTRILTLNPQRENLI